MQERVENYIEKTRDQETNSQESIIRQLREEAEGYFEATKSGRHLDIFQH